jgi:hypothetical protein
MTSIHMFKLFFDIIDLVPTAVMLARHLKQ